MPPGGVLGIQKVKCPLKKKKSELSKVLCLKPGAGQNTALHVLPTAMNSVCLISAFPVHSTSFFSKSSLNVKLCVLTVNQTFACDMLDCVSS